MTQDQSISPGPAYRRLGVFLGTWKTEGQTRPTPDTPALSIAGTDAYEWLDGGFFLIHRVDVRVGDSDVKALEIIGYEAASGAYITRAFDNQGNAGTYRLTVRDGVWTFVSESGRERARAEPSADGQRISVHWERLEEGSSWAPWMDLILTRLGEGYADGKSA